MSLVDTTAWRLPTSTRRPRSSPSELSRLLDRAITHLDRLRQAPHGNRIGGIGTRGDRSLNQPLGAIGEGGIGRTGRLRERAWFPKTFISSRGRADISIKWRLGAAGSTAVSDILRRFINTSYIMVGNAASIMTHEARFANAD